MADLLHSLYGGASPPIPFVVGGTRRRCGALTPSQADRRPRRVRGSGADGAGVPETRHARTNGHLIVMTPFSKVPLLLAAVVLTIPVACRYLPAPAWIGRRSSLYSRPGSESRPT